MTGKRVPQAALLLAATTSLVLLAVPTASADSSSAAHRAARGGPGVWTMIAKVDNSFDYPGVFRTPDGKLHVVWRKQLSNNNFTFGYTNIALNGAKLTTGDALANWNSLEEDPVLVHNGNGMRLLFKGGQDTNFSNFFSRGSVYTKTSSNGTAWTLVHDSVMQHTVLNGSFSATAEQDDTPVAVAGLNAQLFVHEGVDPDAPASAADTTLTLASGDYGSYRLVTASDGSVWVGYFRFFSANNGAQDGYYVQQVLPSTGQPMKAPNSHLVNVDNEPRQAVALAARAQGGLYMAYCAPAPNKPCAHVNLWKVGSSSEMTVPGTSSGTITRVAIADGLQGRLSIVTGDSTKGTINAVRTNTGATGFGVVRTMKMPKGWFNFNTLEAEGTFGRLDIVGNFLMSQAPNPIELWHTQILAGLTLTASPAKFANTAPHTVTFTVKDAGQPVKGAKVSCKGLTKTDTTDSAGKATLAFPKNFPTGQHVCTAGAADYNPGKATLTVTHGA